MHSVDLCVLTHKKSHEGHGTERSGSGNIRPLAPEQSWQRRCGAPSTSIFLIGDQVGEAPHPAHSFHGINSHPLLSEVG